MKDSLNKYFALVAILLVNYAFAGGSSGGGILSDYAPPGCMRLCRKNAGKNYISKGTSEGLEGSFFNEAGEEYRLRCGHEETDGKWVVDKFTVLWTGYCPVCPPQGLPESCLLVKEYINVQKPNEYYQGAANLVNVDITVGCTFDIKIEHGICPPEDPDKPFCENKPPVCE